MVRGRGKFVSPANDMEPQLRKQDRKEEYGNARSRQ